MTPTITDLSVINESLFGLFKELENLAVFKKTVKDGALGALLHEQSETHLANYHALVQLLQASNFAQPESSRLTKRSTISDQSGVHDMIPDLNISSADDRLIAYSHFLAVSRAGREYGWYLFEVTYPPLQDYLEKTLHLYINDARAIKAWIMDQGYYFTQWATPEQVASLQGLFNSGLHSSPYVGQSEQRI